jgi:hypothetical protein
MSDPEYYRKGAKSLLRAFHDGDPEAAERAQKALGERSRDRFLLSDAQFVVAREHGHRSWAEFKQAMHEAAVEPDDRLERLVLALSRARAGWGERGETVLDSGVAYGEGDPVLVWVRKRAHRYSLDDDGVAVARAGRPPGWHELARRIAEEEYWLNVNRRGVVCVSAVEGGVDLAWLSLRIADASVAVYQALLELDE